MTHPILRNVLRSAIVASFIAAGVGVSVQIQNPGSHGVEVHAQTEGTETSSEGVNDHGWQ
ncbi:hypothetical protein [Streptomyces griseus]|uniref:hypothetical protein n=1 Tax=Streptomyces griseus TaxID=1911 RepID=UPI001112D7D8|nr:hypothetical protein [Streptomyces griseus]